MIELFEFILKGDENKVMELYRKIYDQGIEPKIFINDFLEILYYFKNIHSLTLESTNFSLNDVEFNQIKETSDQIENDVLILFWQFTIQTLKELEIVSNQHLSIEMFLMRLMYLSGSKKKIEFYKNNITDNNQDNNSEVSPKLSKSKIVNQIKSISQEVKSKPELQSEKKIKNETNINSLKELIEIFYLKKEIKLKYELENNVNLVKFENQRIEISFNDNLEKDFVKNLSTKLFEWTSKRWIISFSKNKGEFTIKDEERNKQKELIENAKNSKLFQNVLECFPDVELVKIEKKNDKKE